ncbi:hypothetical protein CC79DRAFT_1359762 [Sarocladium strictum]
MGLPGTILRWVLIAFNVTSIQAHYTDRLTPWFSRNLEEKMPLHNKVLFGEPGLPIKLVRVIFVSLNLMLAVMQLIPSLRNLGLKVGFGLLCVGFYSDLKLRESPIPHLTLFSLVGAALYFAEG